MAPATTVEDRDNGVTRQNLERRISRQAADEGHDADIPSGEGYLLDANGERKRRASLAEKRRNSDAEHHPRPHTAGDPSSSAAAPVGPAEHRSERDVENGTGGAQDPSQDPGSGSRGEKSPSTTDDDEANIVSWDENDPEYPYNWPKWRTFVNCLLVSTMIFITPLASSIFAPGVPQLMQEFHSTSLEMASFVVSVYILGFAFGPLVMAPLSEIYGRLYVYHASMAGFIVFVVACAAAPNLGALVAFRFLSGVFGSCPVTNASGSIADMVRQEGRAAAMAAVSIGPLLGPIVGPIAGGFLADAAGWRWNFWLLAIVGGVIALVNLAFLRESYHPVLLERKTRRLRKATGNAQLRSKLDIGLSPRDYFRRSILRPIKMILFSPIVISTALFMALTYGYLYLMFTSITEPRRPRLLGLGVGSLAGVAVFSGTSDRYIKKKAAAADALAAETGAAREGLKPEYRLPLLPLGSLVMPAGFFIYGWTAEARVHWIAPIIGTAVIGVGNMLIFMCIQLYLVDAFGLYAASAMAANTLVRSIAGAVLPLAGLPMYERLGVGWGNSLLGFIALSLLPISLVIIRYGEYWRKRFVIQNL
ncbi:major facilitator superfamily domain-containing protein [Apiospora phragmitis]|uniref:Major facilitator superfamily domain-containing protein n=1 Tax=Apiospora phragmitis TaxID=2905665 RepID=A0ABR1USC2_9PEZI